MNRVIRLSILAGSVLLIGASTALAAPPSPANPAGKLLGVVHAHGQASRFSSSGSNLSYHSGPVMHVNKTYAIYWVPPGYSVSNGYESLINKFFGDVAAASGAQSNVYFSDTQYYDTVGSISYSSSFGGSYVDTTPFPASGCRDSYTSVCLTDAQIQTEVKNVMAKDGWSAGTTNLYFMFTPKNVGSCAGSECAYSYYCAYHSWIGSGSSATLYANMPYAAWVSANCGSGQSPNNDDADSTLNVTSHEHNEAITDPLGSAWYDRRGSEDGDKCAWTFGTALGSTSSGRYNQQINGDTYYLQREWSNHSSGCVLQGL